jgi:hypothetical protein
MLLSTKAAGGRGFGGKTVGVYCGVASIVPNYLRAANMHGRFRREHVLRRAASKIKVVDRCWGQRLIAERSATIFLASEPAHWLTRVERAWRLCAERAVRGSPTPHIG